MPSATSPKWKKTYIWQGYTPFSSGISSNPATRAGIPAEFNNSDLGECRCKPIYNDPPKQAFVPLNQRICKEQKIMADKNSQHTGIDDHDVAVKEAEPKLKRPSLYRVVLINDDFTPMEFVVEVLESIFGMERSQATRVMLEVHTKGKGICGTYSYEIAETKVAQVTGIAQQQQHPLLCTMEEY